MKPTPLSSSAINLASPDVELQYIAKISSPAVAPVDCLNATAIFPSVKLSYIVNLLPKFVPLPIWSDPDN
jgi:hypothetical protein